MTHCHLCGHDCIPMADYDIPICARCDADTEDGLTPPILRKRRPRRGIAAWAAELPLSYRTGPAHPDDLADLMAAFRRSS